MIFYFTATGNSKFIAERIAAQTGDQIFDIAKCARHGRYSCELADGEAIGFVIPVYYYGIPMIVGEFLQKLNVPKKTYSYAVLNCGGTTADAGGQLRRLFPIDAEFGIIMVDNYVPMYKTASDEEKQARLDKAELAIEEIITRVKSRTPGVFNDCTGSFPRLVTGAVYPLYKYGRKTGKFTVPSEMHGRVFSVVQIVTFGIVPLAMLFYGPLADAIRIESILLISSALLAVVGVVYGWSERRATS